MGALVLHRLYQNIYLEGFKIYFNDYNNRPSNLDIEPYQNLPTQVKLYKYRNQKTNGEIFHFNS